MEKKKYHKFENSFACSIMKSLPVLTNRPKYYADCCASLSSVLISTIAQVLPPKPSYTVSIGSGSGILEALILQNRDELDLEAVEVSACLNQYLPEEKMTVVLGTWDLCPAVGNAAAWMFIYPRDIFLMCKYLRTYALTCVELLLWLGPRVDYHSIEISIPKKDWRMEVIEECTSEYEMLVIWRRELETT